MMCFRVWLHIKEKGAVVVTYWDCDCCMSFHVCWDLLGSASVPRSWPFR